MISSVFPFFYLSKKCLGGNGFVEDWPMARLFRHSPLNAIWEGSGNVIALDVLRGMKSLPILMKEISLAKNLSKEFDGYYSSLEKQLYSMSKDVQQNPGKLEEYQRSARHLADSLAIGMEASILLRYGDSKVAEGYIQSRLSSGGRFSNNYGGHTVYDANLSKYIIERNMPVFNK
jgi:putative acyl-CoA dehydrogenase